MDYSEKSSLFLTSLAKIRVFFLRSSIARKNLNFLVMIYDEWHTTFIKLMLNLKFESYESVQSDKKGHELCPSNLRRPGRRVLLSGISGMDSSWSKLLRRSRGNLSERIRQLLAGLRKIGKSKGGIVMVNLYFRKQSQAYDAIREDEWFSKDVFNKCYRVYRDHEWNPTTVYKVIHWEISDGDLNIPQ